MANKSNPLRRILFGRPRARAPLAGVEVQDSTWAEWNLVVNGEDALAANETERPGDKPRRADIDEKPTRR